MSDDFNTLKYEVIMGKDIRFDPDNSAPDYIGINQETDASDDNNGWVIYKFTYSGGNVTRIQKVRGAWGDRATLF